MTASCFFDPTPPSRSQLGTDHEVGLPTLVSKSRPALLLGPLPTSVLFSQSDHSKPKLSTRSSLPAACSMLFPVRH